MRTQISTSNLEVNISDLSELDTVEELAARYPDKFNVSQLRWALRFREHTGLNAAVVKFGRRLYIHRPTFVRWLASHRGGA
jgi:hypothetical protein